MYTKLIIIIHLLSAIRDSE